MTLWLPFLALALCAAAWYAGLLRGQRDLLRSEVSRLTVELSAANERLLGAWRDGYTIPDVPYETPNRVVEMGESLRRFLDDFDDVGRAVYSREIARMQGQGMTELDILRELTGPEAERLEA